MFIGNHGKQEGILTLQTHFTQLECFHLPRLFERFRPNLRVHLSTYLHTRNFHGYFEIWTPFSSSRLVCVCVLRVFSLWNLLLPHLLWGKLLRRKNSNFEPIRSKCISDFSSRSTATDKEPNKLRTQTHAQLPRQCAATKTVEPTRRVTAWFLPTWREEQP